jgi:thermitase
MTKFMFGLLLAIGFGANAAEYLVKYRNQSGVQAVQSFAQSKSLGLQIMDSHDAGSLILVNIKDSMSAATLAELLAEPGVEYVVPNFKLTSFADAPVDIQALKEQWAVPKIQIEKAWQRAGNKGNRSVLVAVIDTGVDYRHKALAPNMIPGYDFARNDSDPDDQTSSQNPGHGTHCAGMVGATGLIDGGITGMSPDVSMMPLRFLDEKGSGDLNNGIKAIDYAIEKGVQVISASWGAEVPQSTAAPLLEAVKRATDKGIIFVVAAGNSSKNNDTSNFFPANAPYPNVINVAASNKNDGKPSWSNFGKNKVHISSPGENIMSSLPKDKYGNLSGTSMATPIVAGVVAFLKAQDPSLTGVQIKALLQTTGVKNSVTTACNCRVDAFQAVDHLLSKKPLMYPVTGAFSEGEKIQLNVMNMGNNVTYESSNPAVLSVDASGLVTALTKGSAKVTAQNNSGVTVSSFDMSVAGGKPSGSECTLGSDFLCRAACKLNPSLAWCPQK